MAVNEEAKSVGVLTTVFPGVERYFEDFLSSMAAQSRSDFTLVVVNDGMVDLDMALSEFSDLDVQVLPAGKTPAENRMCGIKACIASGFDVVVFADSDDTFASNRIEKSCEILAHDGVDVVVNDVHVVSEKCKLLKEYYFSPRLTGGQVIRLSDITHANVMGLSNTAVRTSVLQGVEIGSDVNIVDWLMYTQLLLRGAVAVFTDATSTNYRQHGASFVGLGEFDEARVKASIRVKCEHYQKLTAETDRFAELRDFFCKKGQELEDEHAMQGYLAACKERMPAKQFWWEEAFYIR